jgi:autotransporter passenger strand-loop-strand repeat protein
MSGNQNTATANIVASGGTADTTQTVNFGSAGATSSGTYVQTSPAGSAGENLLVVDNAQLSSQLSSFVSAAQNGGASIVFLGDSTTQGDNATAATSSSYSDENSLQLSYPYELAQVLSHDGIAASTNNFLGLDNIYVVSGGALTARDGVAFRDERVSISGDAIVTPYGGFAGGFAVELVSSGGSLGFTPDNIVTANEVTIDYAVSGTAILELTFAGTPTSEFLTVTGSGAIESTTISLALSSYSGITVSDTSNNKVYIQGLAISSTQPGTAPSVQIYNAGVDGLQSAGGVDDIPGVLSVNPKLVFVDFGINDILDAPTGESIAALTATISANIQQIVTNLQAGGADVVLLAPTPFNSESYAEYMPQLQLAYQAIAASMNIPLIDLSASYGDDFQALFNAGLTSGDGIHPNATFYADIGAQIAAVLAGVISGSSSTAATISGMSASITGSGSGLVVSDGARLLISAGVETNLAIANGGMAILASGGVLSAADIAGAAGLFVSSGGEAVLATLSAGGGLYLLAGGVTSDTNILSGSAEYVDGGSSFSPLIAHAATETVSSNGVVSGAEILNGGTEVIYAGGVADGSEIFSGAVDAVFGGAANSTRINGGAQWDYGTVNNTIVSGGGLQQVDTGGIANDTTLLNNGSEVVYSGGAALGDIISAGGTVSVQGGSLTNATIAGGMLVVDDGVGTSVVSGAVDFSGTGGQLRLLSGFTLAATISGFAQSDRLDLASLSFVSGATAVLSGNDLTVTAGGVNASFAVADAASSHFIVTADGSGGTDILLAPVCYLAGTRILSRRGETPVESLRIGDEIPTLHAGMQRIKWIGTRAYAAPFCNHRDVLPICIKAGALADGVPSRDLLVSPGHALCLDGVLVHAKRLVNGVSIVQSGPMDVVAYFHIELDTHEIIWAENCPAETFVDEYFRPRFQNAAAFHALYPGETAGAKPCLPRLENGFALLGLQQRIAARAGVFPPAVLGGLRGYIDHMDGSRISGWAQHVLALEYPVTLVVYAAGICLGAVLANSYRVDLYETGHGSGYHGFEFLLPPGVVGEMQVRRACDGAVLAQQHLSLAETKSKRSLF